MLNDFHRRLREETARNEAQLKDRAGILPVRLVQASEFIPAEKDKQETYASFSPVQERETHCESAWPLTEVIERLAAAIASTPRIRLVSNRLQHLLGRQGNLQARVLLSLSPAILFGWFRLSPTARSLKSKITIIPRKRR